MHACVCITECACCSNVLRKRSNCNTSLYFVSSMAIWAAWSFASSSTFWQRPLALSKLPFSWRYTYIYIYIYMYVYRYISVYMRNTLLNKARIITMYVYLLQIASCINWLFVAANESGAQAALQDLAIGIKRCKSRERGRKPGKKLNVRRSLRGYLLDLLLLSLSLSLSPYAYLQTYIHIWMGAIISIYMYIHNMQICMHAQGWVCTKACILHIMYKCLNTMFYMHVHTYTDLYVYARMSMYESVRPADHVRNVRVRIFQ